MAWNAKSLCDRILCFPSIDGSIVFYRCLKDPFGQPLIYTVIALALVQAIVQLLFFLHVGQEAKPRWETVVFYFMVVILFIIAAGSLWIMNDLNDRVMTMEMPHD